MVAQALAQIRVRQATYRLYGDYYAGRHRLAFATEKFRNAFGSILREFACNLCGAIVDTIGDRLEVSAFGVDSGPEDAAGAAWAIWQANRMDVRAIQVHIEALRCGDAYCIVWPDGSGNPTLYPQRATSCTVHYSEETPGLVEWAAKVWVDPDKRCRLNLYYADRIEKYATAPRSDNSLPDDAKAFAPLADEEKVPNPWGVVPVFHFATRPEIGGAGVSELRDLIAPQDAYNKSILDTLVGSEYMALPQRYATGIEVDTDPDTGKPQEFPFVPGAGRVWTAGAPDAKFGQFDQADLEKLLAVQTDWEMKIARLAGVPPHYMQITNDAPSGEALKTLEARFVKKCRRIHATYGNAWEDAMTLALRMARRTEKVSLRTEWVDPAPVGEREKAETVNLRVTAGISRREALRQLGYSDKEIEKIMGEAQVERDMATPSLGNPFAGA